MIVRETKKKKKKKTFFNFFLVMPLVRDEWRKKASL